METEVIITYVTCDDLLQELNFKDDIQIKMKTSEIMTTAIIAAFEFAGNVEKARKRLSCAHFIPNMLSKGQLNRRLHRINSIYWIKILKKINEQFGKEEIKKEYVIDSFPVEGCKLIRCTRSHIYKDKKYKGYCAAKKEFFNGIKVHVLSSTSRIPVEFKFSPGSEHDLQVFKSLELNLAKNSVIYADKAYNDYHYEDHLIHKKQIHLLPIRKKNSHRRFSVEREKIIKKKRKVIETMFSNIKKLMPQSVHAVTKNGFELKITLFILAYTFNVALF